MYKEGVWGEKMNLFYFGEEHHSTLQIFFRNMDRGLKGLDRGLKDLDRGGGYKMLDILDLLGSKNKAHYSLAYGVNCSLGILLYIIIYYYIILYYIYI